MPHLSGKEIKAAWDKKIRGLLIAVAAKPSSAKIRERIIGELLTDVEQLMLAKRIALLAMIRAEFSSYTIKKRLNVSTSTIKRFSRSFDRGGYEHITAELQKLQEKETFWEMVEKISRGGLPPVVGKAYRPTLLRKRPRKQ